MEKIQKVIIVFLIIAIVFSVVSTVINYSLLNFEIPVPQVTQKIPRGNPNGNVKLFVEGNPPAVGG